MAARLGERTILDGVDLLIERREVVAVKGPSGSGKTTLLNCIAGLLPVTSGEVFVAGISMTGADERQRATIRRERIGFVFQFGELLPELSGAENVELPLRLRGIRSQRHVVSEMLAAVGSPTCPTRPRRHCRAARCSAPASLGHCSIAPS